MVLLPIDASLHGPAMDTHLRLNLWMAVVLLVAAHLLLLVGLFRGRRAHGRRRTMLFEYAPLAAVLLLYVLVGVRSEQLWAAQRYTGADPAAMQVEVTGMQFAWYFRYPGRDAAFGRTRPALIDAAAANPLGIDPADPHGADDFLSAQLVLPVDREVDITLVAQDVIHGFAVPEMRLKQNAVPGSAAHIHFMPTRTGDFAILCTQVCGSGHYRMNATMRVVSQADFERWLAAREQVRR